MDVAGSDGSRERCLHILALSPAAAETCEAWFLGSTRKLTTHASSCRVANGLAVSSRGCHSGAPQTWVTAGEPIDDRPNDVSDGRVFRGIVNPAAQDRVEVVHFPEAGTYLVICGILPHLQDDMFGWVKGIR
jgi:hypothetical protein